MTIHVDENWWKDLFDEVYLLTDARSVCNDALTAQEVDFLIQALKPERDAPILDLCGGQGRHSLELSRRGFMNVTVLDYSRCLVDLGKRRARQENLETRFIQADARNPGLSAQSFRHIIIMASSFGYFMYDDENRRLLTEAFRLLEPKGMVLLDLPDRDHVVRNFKPFSSHRVNADITVTRERILGDDIIYSREMVMSERKGCVRTSTYCTRLYTGKKISDLLRSAGFSSIECTKGFMNRAREGDFGCMTNRMIVTAHKD